MGQDGYHKAVTAMPQRQQQTSPEVEQLRAEMAQMKAEQTRNAVIGPFAAQNPRFNEPAIQQSIAQILKSDMVSKALPAQERDRKSVGKGKSVSVRVRPGGARII